MPFGSSAHHHSIRAGFAANFSQCTQSAASHCCSNAFGPGVILTAHRIADEVKCSCHKHITCTVAKQQKCNRMVHVLHDKQAFIANKYQVMESEMGQKY